MNPSALLLSIGDLGNSVLRPDALLKIQELRASNHTGRGGSFPFDAAHAIAATAVTAAAASTDGDRSTLSSQQQPQQQPQQPQLKLQRPIVSVCVVHHERGPLLLQALESIRQQSLAASFLRTPCPRLSTAAA